MRPFATVEMLLIVALLILLTSFPLLDYGLRHDPIAALAGGVLALIGCSMPLVARVTCPTPEEKRSSTVSGEHEHN